MPAALALLVVAIALAVLLAVKTQAAEQHAGDDPAQEQGRTVVAAGATAASSSAAAGMTREQAMDVFRADRTWYSHWEKKDRKKPLKWTVNGDTIVAGSDVDKPGRLEQRWVLLMDGHLFVIMDDQTLTGFFARTGRAKGYFTDDSPQAK